MLSLLSESALSNLAFVFFNLQPVMALFRPGPGDSKRPIFNWAHWGVGITAYILSGKYLLKVFGNLSSVIALYVLLSVLTKNV